MMDDNKVAVLLEQLLSEFRAFGDGQQILLLKVESFEAKTDRLIEDMDVVKNEIVKLNPESRAIFMKQVKYQPPMIKIPGFPQYY